MATIQEHLENLSAEALRDLARNGSAQPEYRKAAADKLVEMEHRYALLPEIAVIANPYTGEYGAPVRPEIVSSEPGPLVASITTETLHKNEIVDQPIATPEEADAFVEKLIADGKTREAEENSDPTSEPAADLTAEQPAETVAEIL